MKKTLLFLFFAVIGCLSSYAAGDWLFIGENNEFKFYINSDITEKYGEYRVWEKYEYKKAKKLGSGKRAKYYSSAVFLVEYDSDFTRSRLLSSTYYSKRGNVVDSFSYEYSDWVYIVPDSVGEFIVEAIQEILDYYE